MSLKNLIITAVLPILFAVQSQAAFKVGLVLDKGGKDDKSFNSSAFEGAKKAEKELGIELKYVEATDINAIDTLLRSLASKDFDIVIGIGFAQVDAIRKVAKQFPQKKFVIVDGQVDPTEAPNVRSLLFEEHEGSYLVGALAALKTQALNKGPAKIGFIGGMDVPLIRRFAMGYEAGVKKISPNATVVRNFVGISDEAWANPAKAKELALNQYHNGVEIIFSASGASNHGVFDAAEDTKKLAIGVDSNQNWIKPGFILTSMLKRVDISVYDSIKIAKEGHFTGGVIHYGLRDKGVDYVVDSFNEKLVSAEDRKVLENLKKEILAGKITVPDYYKTKK
jgi:basic membrane protein A